MFEISRISVLAFALVAMIGCKPPASEQDAAGDKTGNVSVRDSFVGTKLLKGRMICPLEFINGQSIRDSRSLPAGSKATLVGWSRVADQRQPVPPLVHVVFRSTVQDGSADLFWPGLRVARPELAQNDQRLALLGYSASGTLPASPGKYKVLVWVGDPAVQRECDTGEVLELGG